MSAYLGTLGRLVPLWTTPSMETSGIPSRSYETTLEGRVKVQVRPVGRRSWSLSAEYSTAGELGTLLGFASGEWGHGPFVWVPPTAPALNMLTPAQASCDPSGVVAATNSAAGPMLTPDGWAGRSYVNSDPTALLWFGNDVMPVLPGQPVTASAYLLGDGARVEFYFYDSSGAGAGVHSSDVRATAGSVVRSYVTATPPANAASCRVLARGATQGARPALTWTSEPFEWAAGEGCTKAVVDAVDRTALEGSTQVKGRQHSNLSFTIREVG